ncbi:MAG: hypothetical protein MJE77_27460 [Proteobacteria bacterium]|nr:hypothetical protein [Pseudomonadota bacterium]
MSNWSRYWMAGALLIALGGCSDVLGIGVVVAPDDAGMTACGPRACDEFARCVDPTSSTPCQCNPGYQGDGFVCQDIDECAVSTHGCDLDATCTNTPGGFSCACNPGYVGDGTVCARPASCAALRAAGSASSTGVYPLDPDGDGPLAPFDAWCDMDADGGGWTLVASVVNDSTRRWNGLDVWTGDTVFGTIADRTVSDFKSLAFARVRGSDFLVRTVDYAFAFHELIPDTDLASFIQGAFPDQCNVTYQRSAPDWHEGLTDDQASVLGFLVRPLDSNAACFPNGNENALIGLNLASCCWAGGLGNTPAGQAEWSTHDLSLLTRDRLIVEPCTAGVYPCNDNGVIIPQGSFCYNTLCKVAYAEVYLR